MERIHQLKMQENTSTSFCIIINGQITLRHQLFVAKQQGNQVKNGILEITH
jgi:hypothetical protein